LNYNIKDIAAIVDAQSVLIRQESVIENILTDSRRLVFPATTLFFAINGPRRSGSSYIENLYEKEVRNFIVDVRTDQKLIDACKEANFLLVDDVLLALQQLAAFHRNNHQATVIGITGSNGKTIVKEWLFQSLHHNYNIVRSPKSYNSQIGVPLSVLQMTTHHNLAIFEAGISVPGEMEKLEKIIHPDIGVLTYIGDAHAEGFESMEQKIKEKLMLFSCSKVLVYCSDNDLVDDLVKEFAANQNSHLKLFTWSRTKPSELNVTDVRCHGGVTDISLQYRGEELKIAIPFTDEAALYNAVTCVAVMLQLGIDKDNITTTLKELSAVAMRLELKQAIGNSAVINDSYNADMDSLLIALDFLSQQQAFKKKTLILSDLFQSGLPEKELYSKIASLLLQKNITRFIGIGNNISANANCFDELNDATFYDSTATFLKSLPELYFNNEAILLKGSRIFEFEKISNLLEQKLHDTLLEINLNAIRQNLKRYREKLSPTAKIMAMVKAFSYGSGSVEIATVLQQEGVEYLAVAYADEAVELRNGGVRLPIMVMNAGVADFDNIIRYRLEPEIYSFRMLHAFKNHLAAANISGYAIHLKLDTGMHRLGFMKEDINTLCEQLQSSDKFEIKSVFSHLVASENPDHDEFTKHQADLFEEMSNQIQKTVKYHFIKHIANTSAIHRHPELQFDMVRLGIGMYGVDSGIQLQNVTTLKTTIAQIKNIRKGETVGYGRKGILHHDAVVATVRIGYADGYPRAFGNGNGKMLVNGKMAPVIGNVCMDMTMLDITGINAAEGDQVIVFGELLPVEQIAPWANTIPYEILTNISQRVKRVYYEE